MAAAKYRVLSGITFDAPDGGDATRVEPGDLLPPVSKSVLKTLLACGAVAPDEEA